MATNSKTGATLALNSEYPTSDGKPMAETDWHRDLMIALIQTLMHFYAKKRRVYVSGNLLIFYEQGNKRKHVSPDVFVVKGVPKKRRLNYLVWLEGKGPDFIIELTSRTTRKEDVVTKFQLYQNVLRVGEYFLFDPLGHYLDEQLKGYRLENGLYVPIDAVNGRLPSEVVGLHLETDGLELRLYNPVTDRWIPTPAEIAEAEREARQQAEGEVHRLQIEAEGRKREAEARHRAEAEVQRLKRELDELRRRLS
jgi:Uma2 family endonuclease